MTIQVLPRVLVDQIAAGEVVERPASVVKELVDNAVDAGSVRIEVELAEGGTRLVRVTDDGSGVPADELALAVAPHATSKIGAIEDLESIGSLGFRGEALASIASVSRFRMVSRVEGSIEGAEIAVEGGGVSGPRPAASPQGTQVEVRDLFFNVPARARFLKTVRTEASRCIDVCQQMGLSFPEIGWRVVHDGREVLEAAPGSDRMERWAVLFGAGLAEGAVQLFAEADGISLEALLGAPAAARGDTRRLLCFVNGRPVRDPGLIAAVRGAYRDFLPPGRSPVACVFLGVDPARVDVNVHPRKAEVRFRGDTGVVGFVRARLTERLRSERPVGQSRPLMEPSSALSFGSGTAEAAPAGFAAQLPGLDVPPSPRPAPMASGAAFMQVQGCYLVREWGDGMEVIDQHALAERIAYEDLKRQVQDRTVEAQRLLVPEVVEIEPADAALLEGAEEGLRAAGLEVEPFGGGTVRLRSLPSLLGQTDAQQLLGHVVEALRAEQDPDPVHLLEEVLHRRACRSSVRAGDRLVPEEVEALLRRAEEVPVEATCPHGRPTRVRLTARDLERAFLRS